MYYLFSILKKLRQIFNKLQILQLYANQNYYLIVFFHLNWYMYNNCFSKYDFLGCFLKLYETEFIYLNDSFLINLFHYHLFGFLLLLLLKSLHFSFFHNVNILRKVLIFNCSFKVVFDQIKIPVNQITLMMSLLKNLATKSFLVIKNPYLI